jgi:hypothetical protein
MNEQLKSFLDGEMDSVNSIEFEKLLAIDVNRVDQDDILYLC